MVSVQKKKSGKQKQVKKSKKKKSKKFKKKKAKKSKKKKTIKSKKKRAKKSKKKNSGKMKINKYKKRFRNRGRKSPATTKKGIKNLGRKNPLPKHQKLGRKSPRPVQSIANPPPPKKDIPTTSPTTKRAPSYLQNTYLIKNVYTFHEPENQQKVPKDYELWNLNLTELSDLEKIKYLMNVNVDKLLAKNKYLNLISEVQFRRLYIDIGDYGYHQEKFMNKHRFKMPDLDKILNIDARSVIRFEKMIDNSLKLKKGLLLKFGFYLISVFLIMIMFVSLFN